MGFIDDNLRDEVKAESDGIDQITRSIIDRFCSPENLAEIVRGVRESTRRSYLANRRPVTSVAVENDNVTPTVVESEECKRAVLEAVRMLEPAASAVTFSYSVDIDHSSFVDDQSVVVYFDPPLS